ncbi:hypothetical protein NKR19_g1829 [Coniochaeta hoffmannii]|uniref:Uncharacterized protein n=1 Tax=Coniochaeta hoffmannii TaxID=91930 RepID=A0AA38W0I7_9PEZI|nr:hypothetical protein NKR19_g1829 [Coniochaeta hoffmannii]
MQSLGNRHDISKISLGDRRGQSDLARFSLDLTWARADSESAARSKGYPSPPMSGSPPLPPKGNQDSAAERTRGSYQATTQDAHRGISATQMDAQTHRAGSTFRKLTTSSRDNRCNSNKARQCTRSYPICHRQALEAWEPVQRLRAIPLQ